MTAQALATAPAEFHIPAPRFERRPITEVGEAFATLRDEFLAAVKEDPQRVVRTPGFGAKYTVAQLIVDDIDGCNDTTDTLVRLLSAAAAGENVQMRISAWVYERATKHARFHADDLVEQERGE